MLLERFPAIVETEAAVDLPTSLEVSEFSGLEVTNYGNRLRRTRFVNQIFRVRDARDGNFVTGCS